MKDLTVQPLITVATFFAALTLMFACAPAVAEAGSVTLNASPSSVYAGDNITVTWSSSGNVYCSGSGFSTGGATSGTRTVSTSYAGTKNFSIVCYDATPACSLTQVSSFLEDARGRNTCTNMTYYGGSCFPKGATCSTSVKQGSVWRWTRYQCTGSCSTNSASKSVTVNSLPPPPDPSVTLTLSPTTVGQGESALISWTSTRATTCRGTGFSTEGQTSGSVSVTPSQNTTYSITCDSEVYGAAAGTYEYAYRDVTDLWCTQGPPQPNYSNYYTNNQCPGNSDPTGGSCSGSEICAVNSWSGGPDTVGGSTYYCNLRSDVYRCNGGSAPNQITDSVSVTYNNRPTRPTVTGPSTGTVGIANNFNFTATDLDGDTVRFRIDWDDDGSTTDSPGSKVTNYVASGVASTQSQTWDTPGVYTFKAYTQDNKGTASSPLWSDDFTITIGDPTPQCSDGIDNDGDGLVDTADYGCVSGSDTTESPNPECSDGTDNDGDGDIDYPDDPGCISFADTTESPNPQCSDGIDNDGNGLTDLADPGCDDASDNNETAPAVEADITFDVAPNLVRSGNSVSVTWSVTDVSSCTVVGSNGDTWSGISGSETSLAITAETTFVIVCEETDGDTVSASETIKLVPIFEEVFRLLPTTLAMVIGAFNFHQ